MKELVCCAMPFGYGPAAKLITLASILHNYVDLTFLGNGISYELVARSPRYFKQILDVQADNPLVKEIILQGDAVLSIMDRQFAQIANQLKKPLYVVDSLLWMRDRVPDEFICAKIYWAQNFPGLGEILQDFQPLTTLVGPIVDPHPRQPSNRGGLLINLGGCQTPNNDKYQHYADFVLEGVRESRLLEVFEGNVTVIGGKDCLKSLSYPDMPLISVPYEEAKKRITQSAVVLTAPGMTTTLECFNQGIPTFFLPPENYSQCCILEILRQHGLAEGSFDWADLLKNRIHLRLAESKRPQVVNEITRLIHNNAAQLLFKESLEQLKFIDPINLLQKQKRFLNLLGSNGAMSIMQFLLR